MSENKNEVLLAMVSDLSRRRKRIMKREMGLDTPKEHVHGECRDKKLFPPDLLSQRGQHGHHGHGCHKIGPPMARLRILSTLCEMDGISQSKLATILSIRPQSLTELLGKMEADGMIARKPNEADKRETLVCITEGGRSKIAAYEAERVEYAESFFEPLSDEEKDQLIALLEKLLENE